MKKLVSELSGVELDWWVANATGMLRAMPGTMEFQLGGYHPSTNLAQGGPLTEKYIASIEVHSKGVTAFCPAWGEGFWTISVGKGEGPDKLTACMRAIVASRFGDTVGIESSKDG